MLHTLSLMLHGYGSDAEAFRRDTKMDEAAVKRGYGEVYVTGSHYEQDKTSATGWNSGIGESSSDDVVSMKLNGSHRFSQAPAIEDVIEYFVSINNLNKNIKDNISDKVKIEKNIAMKVKNRSGRSL